MPNKILIPLQSLIPCFLKPPMNIWAAVGATEDSGHVLFGMSQRHYLLNPSSCYPSQWGFFYP